ncbi:MAG: DUF4197 domain-containing protein [Spirochaetaceae bacterium]|nr:DUF4197 domain-containing protein [Spirochaetaceae bacterium]MBR4825090.1 DUF4197 domain-containing protein [Spirochaetaceae bacterium]
MKHLRLFTALLVFSFAGVAVFATGAQDTSLNEARRVLGTESSESSASKTKKTTTTTTTKTAESAQVNSRYGFSNDDAVQALKAALNEGAKVASSQLSKEDAYYKNPLYYIDLPPETEKLVATVSKLPNGKKNIENVILRLNRTAEACAADIIPVFAEAITGMTVGDGVAIVTGKDNAATEYLKKKTYEQLVSLYKPKISAALDQKLVGGMSANEAWEKLTATYNKAGGTANKVSSIFGKEAVKEVDIDLAQYATEKALDAVFLKIADEEAEIRDKPLEYSSDIIRKVFGSRK